MIVSFESAERQARLLKIAKPVDLANCTVESSETAYPEKAFVVCLEIVDILPDPFGDSGIEGRFRKELDSSSDPFGTNVANNDLFGIPSEHHTAIVG